MIAEMPPMQEVRGIGTVELFEDGRRVEQMSAENFINVDSMNYANQQYRGLFAQTFLGVNNDTPAYVQWLNTLILNTDSEAILAPEAWPKGQLIGYANKTAYTGADVFRGTLNTVDSVRNSTMVRWVFDWPTHAANGTFRSIIWNRWDPTIQAGNKLTYYYRHVTSPTDLLDGTQWLYMTAAGQASDITITTPMPAALVQGTLSRQTWLIVGTSLLRFDTINSSGNTTAINLTITAATLGFTPRGCSWDGDGTPGLWCTNISNNTIRKVSPVGATLTSLTVTAPAETGFREIASNATHLWTIGNTTGNVYQIDKTTGAVVTSWTPHLVMTGIAVHPDDGSVWMVQTGSEFVVYRYTPAGVLAGQYYALSGQDTNSVYGEPEKLTWCKQTGNVESFLVFAGYGSSSHRSTMFNYHQMASRLLLPADVTKSAAQTLKVTYEFQFS